MGNPAGVHRDFEGLEQRRRAAAELLRKGMSQAEVARRLGVHRQSVSRWAQQLEVGGPAALKGAGRAGRAIEGNDPGSVARRPALSRLSHRCDRCQPGAQRPVRTCLFHFFL